MDLKLFKRFKNKPGTNIRLVLGKFGINDNAGCGCTDLAYKMDMIGSEAVLREVDSYTNQMYNSIKKCRKHNEGKTIIVVQPPKSTDKLLIEWACIN